MGGAYMQKWKEFELPQNYFSEENFVDNVHGSLDRRKLGWFTVDGGPTAYPFVGF
jgi:hypothetical protein